MAQVLSDHFVREAGGYLDELAGLTRGVSAPDSGRLFRLARGVRGSAQIAEADEIAAVAAHLEEAARALVEGRAEWTDRLQRRFAATVSDLQLLVPDVAHGWTAESRDRVERALARWDRPDADTGSHAEGDVVPIGSLFYDDEGPHILSLPSARAAPAEPVPAGPNPPADDDRGSDDVVPVEQLLFRGERAIEAALGLRSEIDGLLGSPNAELRARMDELWELLELARSGSGA